MPTIAFMTVLGLAALGVAGWIYLSVVTAAKAHAEREAEAGGAAATSSGTNPSHGRLHRDTQHRRWPAHRAHEGLVRAGQREEPDQFFGDDPREATQPSQLLLGEHITGRHQTPQPVSAVTRKSGPR